MSAENENVELVVQVPAARAEMIYGQLIEAFPGGFRFDPDLTDDVEIAVYVPKAQIDAAIDQFRSATGAVDVETRSVAANYMDGWKEFHHGEVIGKAWVGPPWEAD